MTRCLLGKACWAIHIHQRDDMVVKMKFEKIRIIYKFDHNDITNKSFQTRLCITKASTTKSINENMKILGKKKSAWGKIIDRTKVNETCELKQAFVEMPLQGWCVTNRSMHWILWRIPMFPIKSPPFISWSKKEGSPINIERKQHKTKLKTQHISMKLGSRW